MGITARQFLIPVQGKTGNLQERPSQITLMRPRVHVNVAMSADGKLSTRERRQVKISGAADFARVDRLKSESDAIMVGIGTVLADDPSLTIKSPELRRRRKEQGFPENPVRVVVDSSLRIPHDASILHKSEGLRIIACSEKADVIRRKKLEHFASVVISGKDRVDLTQFLSLLYERGIHRLMVEGGGTLIGSLFEEGLVDDITCFVGNMIIGGSTAPTLADGEGFVNESAFPRLSLYHFEQMDQGILLHWKTGMDR
jgi:2,5-diamino-6-(ribosylamino)-4(3H)-pyrimidinone 5'-phosphate reductase